MHARRRVPSSQAAAPNLGDGAGGVGLHQRHGASENGGNGLERQRVSDIQRARMLTAMVEVAAERGAANVTVAHVVERAGVSRRTFYELFEDRNDCLLAAIDDAIACAARAVLHEYDASGGRWRERMRAGLAALLRFFEREPGLARLLVVETLGGGRGPLERRADVLARVIAAVEQGRVEAKAVVGTNRLAAEGVVGAVLAVLHGRLLDGETSGLSELLNPLMSMIVLPYLGPAAARRELERRPPKLDHSVLPPAEAGAHPLKDLHMRLTYRTVRVLLAVAAHPGSSNRVIADAAEVSDQGQISKLLARLHGLGLIERSAGGFVRGEPNAWTLTQRGWQVHATIGERTPS